MSFRNISSWCIRNPVLPLVLFSGLLLAGIVSFIRMDINNNPDVSFPAVRVEVSQPSAAPSELDRGTEAFCSAAQAISHQRRLLPLVGNDLPGLTSPQSLQVTLVLRLHLLPDRLSRGPFCEHFFLIDVFDVRHKHLLFARTFFHLAV